MEAPQACHPERRNGIGIAKFIWRSKGSLSPALLRPLARLLRHRLTRVLWILSRLRKVRVRTLHTRVLIAMPKLFFQANIAVVMMLFDFDRAFGTVRIIR